MCVLSTHDEKGLEKPVGFISKLKHGFILALMIDFSMPLGGHRNICVPQYCF